MTDKILGCGNKWNFFDEQQSTPYIDKQYSRVMIPIKGIMNAIGGEVSWDSETKYAKITYTDEDEFHIVQYLTTEGVDRYYLDYFSGRSLEDCTHYFSDAKPVTINNRSYVPIGVILGALGVDVEWHPEEVDGWTGGTVIIRYTVG